MDDELKKLCDAWIVEEAGLDEDGAELRPAGLRLEHAGRYRLTLRPRDLSPRKLADRSSADDGEPEHSALWWTLTSPDENYYFGELELESKPAYDAALLGEALRDSEPFDRLADGLEPVFDAVCTRDYAALRQALKSIDAKGDSEAPGEIIVDGMPGVVGELAVFPL